MIALTPVGGPASWRRADLEDDSSWWHRFDEAEIADQAAVAGHCLCSHAGRVRLQIREGELGAVAPYLFQIGALG